MPIRLFHRNFNIIIALILLLSSGFSFHTPQKAETLIYDITFNDKKVGYLKVSRKVENEISRYSFTSHVHYKLPFKLIEIQFEIESSFAGDQMLHSFSREKFNNELRSHCQVTKDKKGYRITNDKISYQLDSARISHSLPMLYFNRPGHIGYVFSERYGRYLSIQKINENRYMLILPNGGRNYYTYSGELCEEVNAAVPFGKLQFKLQ